MTFGQSNQETQYEENTRFDAFNFFTAIVNGDKIKSAEARNNLDYKGEARTGVWVTTEKGLEFGLLKWDLNSLSCYDYSENSNSAKIKPISGIIPDIVKTYYLKGEKVFFEEIAKAIQGKTIEPVVYTAKATKGNLYPRAIFAVK